MNLWHQERLPEEHITYLNADYSDVQGTSDALEAAGVDTVICAIGVATADTNRAQLDLIKAAQQSKTTRRFVISSFDMLQQQEWVRKTQYLDSKRADASA